jgi:hypothetical protein
MEIRTADSYEKITGGLYAGYDKTIEQAMIDWSTHYNKLEIADAAVKHCTAEEIFSGFTAFEGLGRATIDAVQIRYQYKKGGRWYTGWLLFNEGEWAKVEDRSEAAFIRQLWGCAG